VSAEETGSPGAGGAAGGPPSFPGNAPPPPPPPAQSPPAFPTQTPTQGGYPPPPPPQYEQTPPYATWGIRLGGYLIDFVIFAVVLVILALVFRHSHSLDVHLMAKKGARRRSFSAVPFLITAVLYVAYGTILCGSARGQTVGMMAVGVRAVRDQTFEVLGYGRALGRALVEGVFRLLSLFTVFLGLIWLLDMLFPLWDSKRQTLHDKVAGSVVLRVRAPAG
jgi:uncharacterized RDD family membrane protein YckC